jgi:hypothetical protein
VSDELIKLYLWNIKCNFKALYKIFIVQMNIVCLIHS